ncbi:MAG: hypothetical protein DMF74_21755 [Acidobacteria bacterium]|nr:MAG: hypothetical protein DMF74_21755 [Acidobacteriota bacterium]
MRLFFCNEFDRCSAEDQSPSSARIGGSVERLPYDAANRVVVIRCGNNNQLATYIYGDLNERLIADEGGVRTYYVAEGGATIAEYTESGDSIFPAWSKSYVYLGGRLLATLTPNNFDGESTQFHHPDRLGTRIVTNPANGTFFEQQTLPFGTALNESPPTGAITGETNRRFTSYDRSPTTKLDYAVNRHYDPQQGRFTQVDPIGMSSVSLASPQTLNLYAYCANDPINHTDPSGLGFFSKLWHGIKKIITSKWFQIALAVAIILIAHYYPNSIFGALGGGSHVGGAAPLAHGAGAGLSGATAGLAAGAAAGAAAATAPTYWIAAAWIGTGAAASSGIATAVSLGLAGALAAGQIAAAIQEPKIRGRSTDEQREQFKKAYEDLRDRILNRADCAKLFGGAAKALNRLARANITLFSKRPFLVRGKEFITPTRVVGNNNLQINTYGGLFAGYDNPALAIGHELGHLLKIYGKDEWDGGNAAMSARNTARVVNACFK